MRPVAVRVNGPVVGERDVAMGVFSVGHKNVDRRRHVDRPRELTVPAP
jgi:hypothetical protein